jgi:hypothetical protein
MRVLLYFILSLATSIVCADAPPTHLIKTLPPGYMMCPKISELHLDPVKMIWFANNGWKSFSPSFSQHIDAFLGAQWQGVNLGNISCVYRGGEHMSFPIILTYNNLVFVPSDGSWGKNLGGYINCKSRARINCIFKPQAQPKSGNIYQQASELKGSNQQEMGY